MATALTLSLRNQAKQCGRLGSILYAGLLERAAAETEAGHGGICGRLLRNFSQDPPQSLLALRFLGAVNRLVIEGHAPDLTPCYVGDILDLDETWRRFCQVAEAFEQQLPAMIRCPVRTNEIGRSAALLPGFLQIARQTGLSLRLLEVGACAGLNLRWDRYFYEASNEAWGDPASAVMLRGCYRHHHPQLEGEAHVMERSGCDEHPLHAASGEDALTLLSYVWPDQAVRVQRMQAAIQLAQHVPVTIDEARAEEWIDRQLKWPVKQQATVVYHSMYQDSMTAQARARFQFVVEEAGKRATADAPIAWLRMEPGGVETEVKLRIWPGGSDTLVALAGFHGQWVESPNVTEGGASRPVRLS